MVENGGESERGGILSGAENDAATEQSEIESSLPYKLCPVDATSYEQINLPRNARSRGCGASLFGGDLLPGR